MNRLLEVRELKKYFPLTKGILRERVIGQVKAVDGVSFTIAKGETLGLVGESGCGKTTTGRCIMGLEEPTSGKIIFEDKDLGSSYGVEFKKLQGRVQIIFQDPYGSLDPRLTAEQIISEPLRVEKIDRSEAKEKVKEVMYFVGLDSEMIKDRKSVV